MVYGHFDEKAFTKVSYIELVCLDFKGNELEFWLLKRQTFECWPHVWQGSAYPHFQQLLQLRICGLPQKMDFPFYQCTGGHKRVIFCEVATMGRVQKGNTQILEGMGP
jgi:hypothetical protein